MKADRKAIIAVVLVLAAIGLVVYQLTGGMSAGKSNANAAAVPATTTVAKKTPQPIAPTAEVAKSSTIQDEYDNLIAAVSEKDLAYRSPSFRNPMLPLIPDSKSEQVKADLHFEDNKGGTAPIDAVAMGYSIQGIIWTKAAPLALINNQVVGIGETLEDGAVVTEITKNMAKFTKRGKSYFLVFREE